MIFLVKQLILRFHVNFPLLFLEKLTAGCGLCPPFSISECFLGWDWKPRYASPIGSMYGMFTIIYPYFVDFMVNVAKYIIHGSWILWVIL